VTAEADAARYDLDEDAPSTGARDDAEDDAYAQTAADTPTLRSHLLSQLSLTNLVERDRRLVSLLIDSLDDDGYLTLGLEELLDMLPQELEVEPEELKIALRHLQNFEPAGVGARSLGECLALQLAALPECTPHRSQALEVVQNHLDALAARDFGRLRKVLHCDDECLRAVQKLITGLNPKPAREFSSGDIRYVVPDVIVRKTKGVWIATLNQEAMPKLRINRLYADILSRNRSAGAQQLASQLQEAKWLIKNVRQRFDTILRVSQAIIDRQRHFFEHGEVAMRPLVLREIADALGLHESTVSRVTTQKYMHTPRGIFELKYFFGSHVTTEAGGAASSTAIRALIKQLVGFRKLAQALERQPDFGDPRAAGHRGRAPHGRQVPGIHADPACQSQEDPLNAKERTMNLHLTGHHLQITPAIRDYISGKLARISHHFDHVIDVNVILSVEKLQQKVEATVHVRGKDIFCESSDVDMYAAIDSLADKLDRSILRHKEKNLARRQTSSGRPEAS
jgi:RNA polymerase sigma-54 factor